MEAAAGLAVGLGAEEQVRDYSFRRRHYWDCSKHVRHEKHAMRGQQVDGCHEKAQAQAAAGFAIH